jgi:uncharacterized membrane protein
MRSKASYKGHPLHPALIPFPFAFLYGAFLFDLAGVVFDRESWWSTGAHLSIAGIAMALVAAVPGLIDYRYTVPPKSTGKKRATRHMVANLTAVALFGVAWWLRGEMDSRPEALQLTLEAAGAALLTVGGWMGGVLVNRNQIGVDPRYANAGKWSEVTVDGSAGERVEVAKAADRDSPGGPGGGRHPPHLAVTSTRALTPSVAGGRSTGRASRASR